MSSHSPASIPTALRGSAAASLRAWREMRLALRAAIAIVTAAAAEDRGVLRSACIATEQTGRAGLRVVRDFAEESRTVWCGVPLVGTAVAWGIAVVARVTMVLLSLLVDGMVAADVLLNTAAEWRTLHPRMHSASGTRQLRASPTGAP